MTDKGGSITWGDGDNSGTVIGGGNQGDIYVGSAAKPQPYERGHVRLLAITERGLQIGSALATLVVFLTGYQSATQWWTSWQALLHPNGSNPRTEMSSNVWLFAFIGAVLVAGTLFGLLHTVRHRTHHYSPLAILPGLAGVRDENGTRRLALVRNKGICMTCGGELRFYSRVTQTHREYDNSSHSWRTVVDEREPVAECVRNPRRHWWLLDVTDTDDLDFASAQPGPVHRKTRRSHP
jgi:hypothetical protein